MWAVNMSNLTHFPCVLLCLIPTLHMKLNVVGNRAAGPLKLTVSAENGCEVRGFVVVQHQAPQAVAQILLAWPGEIILMHILLFFNALKLM